MYRGSYISYGKQTAVICYTLHTQRSVDDTRTMQNFFRNLFQSDNSPTTNETAPRPIPPEAQAQLDTALQDLNSDEQQRRAKAALAIDAMAGHFARPDLRQRVLPNLLDALTSSDYETGLRALDALSREPLQIDDVELREQAVRYLIAVAQLEDEYARGTAFSVLAPIATQSEQAAEAVMPMLIETLQTAPGQAMLTEKAKAQEEGVLVGATTLQAVADAMRAESEMRSKAAQAIGVIGETFGEVAKPAVPLLVEAAQQPDDYWLSAMATDALMKIDLPEVKQFIAKLADDE